MFIASLSIPVILDERGAVWVWNVRTHSLVKSINVGRRARYIAVSSDGGRLACVSTDDITIWDLAIERVIARSVHPYPSLPSYSTSSRLRVEFSVHGNTVLITNRNRVDYWCISPASALSPSPLDLPMVLAHMPSDSPSYDKSRSYYEDGEWIHDGRRRLWLPPDKRARTTDSCGEKIAIVSRNGKVYIVDFSSASLSW